jgi:hypothetical protein
MTDTTNGLAIASYGGFVDAIGGIATVVLAILGLAGVQSELMVSIVTIVFGAALLIQGGAMLSEYVYLAFPSAMTSPMGATSSPEVNGVGSLSALFLVGAAGIVLGILALVGIYPGTLTAVAVIAFGAALVVSCNAVWNLQSLRPSMPMAGGNTWHSGSAMVAAEMASGSAGIQALAGLAAVVLGILAVIGMKPGVLIFVALLVLGTTLVLTGTAMSAAVLSFMRPSTRSMARTTTYSGL